MSNRNAFFSNGGRRYTDPTPSRYNSRYNQRNGPKNYRPEPNHSSNGGDDVDTILTSIHRHLTTDGNHSQEPSSRGRMLRYTRGRRPTHSNPPLTYSPMNQISWWRVSIQQAGTIGKERVMSALKAHCPRLFQPYHVNNYLITKFKYLFSCLFF
jgi:hypothetical protein